MFTSRAEHRLLFNHGSAELRLLHHAAKHRLVPEDRQKRMAAKKQNVEFWTQKLETTRAEGGATAAELVRRGAAVELPAAFAAESAEIHDEVLYRARYQGYLNREYRHVQKVAQLDDMRIPPSFDYAVLRGLRRESVGKLLQIRPFTLGQASRISGVSPADISILMVGIESSRGARP
jgi:tRNA uridine 5-carboxymethylaminomethyl modification enzyme